MSQGWRRVGSDAPCIVCGEARGCAYAVDGSAAICQRVRSSKASRSGGWHHFLASDGSVVDAEQIKANTPIDAVIAKYVELRPKAGEKVGICPFHDDSNPSMTVVPEKGFYKCFACGAGGDLFKFVMDFEGCTFGAAVRRIAEDWPSSSQKPATKRERGQKPQDDEKLTPEQIAELYGRFSGDVIKRDIRGHAESLGVSWRALQRLDIGWSKQYEAWTYPMRGRRSDFNQGDRKNRDFTCRVVGFRIRNDAGEKWAVRGSSSGLFIPSDLDLDTRPAKNLFIAEGPTDTAAALTLGFNAIGRPSCSGQEQEVIDAIQWIRPGMAVIMSDPDGVGLKGAEKLASMIHLERACPVKVISPPTSADLRRWVQDGATAESIEKLVDDAFLWTTDD